MNFDLVQPLSKEFVSNVHTEPTQSGKGSCVVFLPLWLLSLCSVLSQEQLQGGQNSGLKQQLVFP